MKRFPKKRIIITGAGSGLGRAISLEFAQMGWKIKKNATGLFQPEPPYGIKRYKNCDLVFASYNEL